jgi:thioredoxin 1
MRALTYLILCFALLAIARGESFVRPGSGKVTVLYFWAVWCGPCKQLSPALQQMADADHDITLKKINADESQAEMDQRHVTALPTVIVYDRNGGIVGTVTGADVKKIKSYVAQAKGAE